MYSITSRIAFATFAVLFFATIAISADPPSGAAVIRGQFGDSEIVVATTDRLAGAIHSLTWNGQEFIDSADHGRQLQSACSFDCGKKGPFCAEAFNPTEAGSRKDGAGDTSSSRLRAIKTEKDSLSTTTQMAFWLAPGEKSDGVPALNEKILSEHLLEKRVAIGFRGFPNVLDYRVTFTGPGTEAHTYAQYEALTGYMPPEFSVFHTWNPKSGALAKLGDGPGEQGLPVVFSKPDGKYAMAVYSRDQPSKDFENAGYGRFRFRDEKAVKWNCVFRTKSAAPTKPGARTFSVCVVIGTLDDVTATLAKLVPALERR